jgi:hypothetical protein
MALASFEQLQSVAQLAPLYLSIRQQFPLLPARDVLTFVKHGDGVGIEQYFCRHEWVFTGSAYGGDDDSYRGEGRCYCSRCGADGDA